MSLFDLESNYKLGQNSQFFAQLTEKLTQINANHESTDVSEREEDTSEDLKVIKQELQSTGRDIQDSKPISKHLNIVFKTD